MTEIIKVPKYPKFIWAPENKSGETYIVCTNPLSLIWVRKTSPEQLFVVEGANETLLLLEAKQWYLDQKESA